MIKHIIGQFLGLKPKTQLPEKYQDFDRLFEDKNCAVLLREGIGENVIVSFTGVGHAMGEVDVQKPEFLSSLAFGSVIFVVDKNRSWGNNINVKAVAAKIVEYANGRDIFCIGNSMGGFLSILFSKQLCAKKVLSIVPQWSIDARVFPSEKRWENYRKKIKRIIHRDLVDAFSPGCSYLAVFGKNDEFDGIHASMFQSSSSAQVVIVKHAGHNVAGYLKDRGALYPLMNDFFSGASVRTSLNNNGIDFG